MEALLQALFSFFIIMGIGSTILLIIGFLLKSKGVTFVEFFPKKQESVVPQQVIYNNVISQAPTNSYGIDARKVAAIMAAIEHHTKVKA